jgi:hypothetical protein
MYMRYLLWNFAGRQSDNQGKYDNLDGNWMTGIKIFDESRLGSQDNLPSDVLNNKGRNLYFAIPFLLGLLGLIYHANKDLKSFYVLLTLFLFTGIALKIYLNERPFEPRERDYALVGSFYVFAIWIGFGVYALYETLKNWLNFWSGCARKVESKFNAFKSIVTCSVSTSYGSCRQAKSKQSKATRPRPRIMNIIIFVQN